MLPADHECFEKVITDPLNWRVEDISSNSAADVAFVKQDTDPVVFWW